MRSYYEELWERLPPETTTPEFERRREFLFSGLRAGDRALDLGCGEGRFTAELSSAGAQAVGADVAEAALHRARRRYPEERFVLVPYVGPLPFADNSFELVWASEVIEHVADTAPWLSEVRRVLVPGGRLLITTPSHGRLRLALGGIDRFSEPLGDHLHLYSRRSLAGVLGEFGFAAISVRAVGGAPLLRLSLMARAVR